MIIALIALVALIGGSAMALLVAFYLGAVNAGYDALVAGRVRHDGE